MDTSALDLDIKSIIEAFAQSGGLELSQMKEIWQSRGFSFIHEAKSTLVNATAFMQAMYSCCLGCMQKDMPWSRKLGGLYLLYILHETQLFNPPCRIYLCLDALENIFTLVVEAKTNGPLIALKVVQRMMTKGFFLYGSVTTNQVKMKEAINDRTIKAAVRMQAACKKFLESPLVQEHVKGNLVEELGLEDLTLLNVEYNMAKQRIYSGVDGGSEFTGHDYGFVLGDELKKDANAWMERRKAFLRNKEAEDEVPYPQSDKE